MPTRTYTIKFVDGTRPAIAGVKGLTAALLAMEKAYVRAGATARSETAKMVAAMKALEGAAKAAGVATGGVAKGNRSVAAMAKQVETLTARLTALQGAARGATAATATVGKGAGTGKPSGGGGVLAGVEGATVGAVAMKVAGLGIAGAGMAASAMGTALREKREFLGTASERVTEVRSQLKQYAGLRGVKAGPTDAVVKEVVDYARATGASVDEAVDFLTAYEGSATTGRVKGNLPGGVPNTPGFDARAQRAMEEKTTVIAGQFGTATGLDPKTAGDLAGVIGQYTKIRKPEDFAKELGALHYGIDQGRGDISVLARGELGAAGESITSGRTKDLAELGAWIGVTSSISKTGASAGTTYKQVSRLLNELPGSKEGDWLKGVGVTAAEGDTAKLNVLSDYFKAHPELKVGDTLSAAGFGNSTDRAAVAGMIENRDVLNQRIADARKITGEDVLARNAENQQSVLMKTQRGNLAKDAAIIEQGMRQESIEANRRLAEADLIARDRLKSTGVDSLIDRAAGLVFYGETGEQQKVDSQTMAMIARRGKAVGIPDAAAEMEAISWAGGTGSFFGLPGVGAKDPAQFAAAAQRAEARVGAAEALKRLQAAAGQAARAVQQGEGGAVGGETAPAFDPKRR